MKTTTIGSKADYRHEDYFFQRQQTIDAEWEKISIPMPWMVLAMHAGKWLMAVALLAMLTRLA